MSAMDDHTQLKLQAKVFDFALDELVIQHRDSFQPVWTLDSWVKFLIWMALNCGLSGERESLEIFAQALGPRLTTRMRRIFFERSIEDLNLKLMADPADSQVLVLPIESDVPVTNKNVLQALARQDLLEYVVSDCSCWQRLEALLSIPWNAAKTSGEG